MNMHFDEATIDMMLGAVLPPIVSIVQQPHWKDWQRSLVTIIVCGIAGAVKEYSFGHLAGHYAVENWMQAFAWILGSAWVTYQNFWKKTGATKAIEGATAVGDLTDVTEDAP